MKKTFLPLLIITLILTGCQKKGWIDVRYLDYWIQTCQPPYVVQFYLDFGYEPDEYTLNWDFGDGSYSSEKEPIHVYKKNGYYTVKLKIVNYKTTVEKTIVLDLSKEYTQPKIDMDYKLTFGKWYAPCQIEFYNKSQYANQFFWNFGDGTGSDAVNTTHIYSQPGTYNVVLSAICKDTVSQTFQIQILPPPSKLSINTVMVWLPGQFSGSTFYLEYYFNNLEETPNLPSIRAFEFPLRWFIDRDLFFFNNGVWDNREILFQVKDAYNDNLIYSFSTTLKYLQDHFYPDTLVFNPVNGFAAKVLLTYKP